LSKHNVAGAKTNAMRMLDSHHIPYQAYYFSPDIHSADDVAAALDLPASHVYKTLVALRERGRPLLVIVAGDRELDLRKMARAAGEKAVTMASRREAERLTRLQVGGISALALLGRGFEVYLDRPALELESILVSAGQRGINIRLKVEDLVRITGAQIIEATEEAPSG
jgi:Cys-tRNA(Pro)/Cys-tRNA(Cys) deacylase